MSPEDLQPYDGFNLRGGTYDEDYVRRILADAHAHYAEQVMPRAGLAQPAGGSGQMTTAQIAARLRVIVETPQDPDAALLAPACELEAQPAGDASMPPLPDPGGYRDVDGDWVRHGHTDAAMKEYAQAATASLQADLVEERNRIASMRTEHGQEVAALTAQARHAEDCLEAAQARIDALEHDWKGRARTDVGVLLAAFHQEVWDAATAVDEGRPPVDYDLAGIETARSIVEAMHARDMRIAELEAEGAKSERRAIAFDDALNRHILAMRAAFVAWHRDGASEGMTWVINTLAGPGHLPSESDIALGAQALFDKEVAEQEAFRAAHPGPAAPQPKEPT